MGTTDRLDLQGITSGRSVREDLSLVEIRGADAKSFLSNQFASDVSLVEDGRGQLSCWCDPKGRVLFTPLLVASGDTYLCILPCAAVESFIRRLKMFVLRAAVEIIDRGDACTICGIYLDAGAPRHEAIEAHLDRRFDVFDNGTRMTIRLDRQHRRYLLVAPPPELEKLLQTAQLPAIDADWKLFDVAAGLPLLPPELSGEFLPQQLNLDALDAVSFDKGCFPGQEVIARLRYRGTVKKRLLIGKIEPDDTAGLPDIDPGQGLFADAGGEQKIGEVFYPDRMHEARALTAVVDVEHSARSERAYLDGSLVPIRLLQVPYALPKS